MEGEHLRGLEGTNPMGFLAALGVQVLYGFDERRPELWWSEGITPHAVVNAEYNVDCIATKALQEFPRWYKSPAVNPKFGYKADNDAKFKPDDLKEYLLQSRSSTPGNKLASALVAEGGLDNKGLAKPTDLYFTSAALKFLEITRSIFAKTSYDDLVNGLIGPWSYSSPLSSLRWDINDDRSYALSAVDPSKDKKLSNPGVEALAVLGLSCHPVFGGQVEGKSRTLTRGCAGGWGQSTYTWPLWTRPASPDTVRSLLAHASPDPDSKTITLYAEWYPAWHISMILRSMIVRSDPGGYGTFRLPETIWARQ